MYATKRVSAVKSAIWPFASRRSAQCAYASTSSRIASLSAASPGEIAMCLLMIKLLVAYDSRHFEDRSLGAGHCENRFFDLRQRHVAECVQIEMRNVRQLVWSND